jgi:predicted porin
MKKALLAAALMSAGVIAHAQSSVTLYGRLDAGVAYMSGIPSTTGGAPRPASAWKAVTGVPASGV